MVDTNFGLVGRTFFPVLASWYTIREITLPLELLMWPLDISLLLTFFRDIEFVWGLMILGKISLLPGAFIIGASIVFRTKGLESKKEEYLSSFVHSLLILEELNSVSYEEILFVEEYVVESIVPVVNGMIAEDLGFCVSPFTFDIGTESSAYSLPIQSVEGQIRISLVVP